MPHGDSTGRLSDGSTDEESNSRHNVSWTREQKVAMFCIALSNVFTTMSFSILAPFFPPKAEEHGATPSEVGLIFGVFFMSQFVFAIISGKLIPVCGLRPTFIIGYCISATGNILFGFVDMIDNTSAFIGICFSLRILASIGSAAAVTGGLTILANHFPDSMAQPMGNLAACGGLGMIIGPFVGGFLYELGGFVLPFVSLGAAMLVNIFVVMWVLPSISSQRSRTTGSFLRILCVPGVWLGNISIVLGAVSLSFLEPTLSQELQQFNLNGFEMGLVFVLMGVAYSIASPVFGLLSDKFNWSRSLVIVGYGVSVIGYFIIGPWPICTIPHTLAFICFGISLLNIGLSSGLVAGFQDMITSAVFNGFPEDTNTSLERSLWNEDKFIRNWCSYWTIIGRDFSEEIGFCNCDFYIRTCESGIWFLDNVVFLLGI